MAGQPRDDVGPRSGTVFGPYHLRRLLGKGGMGAVYEAFDTVKDRTVAVKLLHERFAKNADFQERFRRESRAAARLREPHVIPIHDWGEIDGVLYIDMRLVTGDDLRAVLRESGYIAPARAVAILSQIASALDAAHADGLVHRDVKPENILVTANDFSYLVDFGIANNVSDPSLTSAGTAIGSYSYMAPERFENRGVTARADIYSLACVLYECITGATPFKSSNVSALMLAHMQDSPVPASSIRSGVPTALDAVIARGLAKNPADRHASAGEFAAAAQAALAPPARRTEPTIAATTPVYPTTQYTAPPPPPVWGSAPATNPMPPPGAATQQPGAGYTPPPAFPSYVPQLPEPPPSRSWIGIAAALAAIAVLGVAAVLAFKSFSGDSDSSSTAARTSSAQTEDSSTVDPTTRGTTTRAQEVRLPPGATPCPARYGPTGDYSTSASGTDLTSCEFAEEVRVAYANGGPAGQARDAVASSPITHQTYTMACSASGPLVTCSGGNNAVVYVY